MCIFGSKQRSPAPLPPAEPLEKADVAEAPEPPKVTDDRKKQDDDLYSTSKGTSALRVNLNLPTATGVNAPN